MPRLVIWSCIVVAAAAAGGCRTTEPVWFIATPGYVESRIARSEDALRLEYEAELAEQAMEIERLRVDLTMHQAIAEELTALARIIREVELNNAELRELGAALEQRLTGLPEETIRLIVEALTRELESSR